MHSITAVARTWLSDPVFQKRCQEAGIDMQKDIKAASTKWIDTVWCREV